MGVGYGLTAGYGYGYGGYGYGYAYPAYGYYGYPTYGYTGYAPYYGAGVASFYPSSNAAYAPSEVPYAGTSSNPPAPMYAATTETLITDLKDKKSKADEGVMGMGLGKENAPAPKVPAYALPYASAAPTLKPSPQPQVASTFGFSNLKVW